MRGLDRRCWAFAAVATVVACASSPPSAATQPQPVALPPPIAVVDCPCDAALCEEMAIAAGCTTGPEDHDGFDDDDGCGDPDNDRDSIPDVADKCPNEPETFNGIDDEDGCPDKSICTVCPPGKIVIVDVVRFDDKGVTIAPESIEMLDALASTLQGNPTIQLVQVEGHSDERGDEKVNLAITEKRAKLVMKALIERGVAKGRLRAKGFGEYCPLDPGHDEAAWAKNRRVSFRIAKYDDQKDYQDLGCSTATAKGVVSDPVP